VVLGYSFPEEDSPSQFLLASLPDNCSILIVDRKGTQIKTRMEELFGFSNIREKNMKFEEWVQKHCPELK